VSGHPIFAAIYDRALAKLERRGLLPRSAMLTRPVISGVARPAAG
jgi:hypothetical protein